MKPIIGIPANVIIESSFHLDLNAVGFHYIESIVRAGGLPLIIPYTKSSSDMDSYVDLCNGFLFCGGGDINPLLFEENPHPLNGTGNLELDQFQISIMKKLLMKKKPVLGICRGAQILNIACGGSIYQDLSLYSRLCINHMQKEEKRYFVTHKVTFIKDSILYNIFGKELLTNSYHHQSINRLGDNLTTTGTTDDKVIEGIEMLHHPFQIGVQWHPENFIAVSHTMLPLFIKLVDTSKKIEEDLSSSTS